MAYARLASPIQLAGALALALSACGGPEMEPGEPGPGSRVWGPSSTALDVSSTWYYDRWLTMQPPLTGKSSGSWSRAELSAEQTKWLEGLVLLPLTDGCTSDGFRYTELVVYEASGKSRAYRSTGRPHLKLEGATAMLPNMDPPSSFWK